MTAIETINQFVHARRAALSIAPDQTVTRCKSWPKSRSMLRSNFPDGHPPRTIHALRKTVPIICSLIFGVGFSHAQIQRWPRAVPTSSFAQSSQNPLVAENLEPAFSLAPLFTPNLRQSAGTQENMGSGAMGAPGLVPPGLMVGRAGRWMVGYQIMFDNMDGNVVGTHAISNAGVLKSFMGTPTDMTMRIQMGAVMYAPTEKLTLMVMVPYAERNMNHLTRDGRRPVEQTSGIGDVELRGLYTLYSREGSRHRLLLNAGLGLPTGSIDRKMGGMRLEYPMQPGTGTVSLMPGLTYAGQSAHWGWGGEFIPTLRVGRNSNGYRFGNRYQPSLWGARQVTRWLSLSATAKADVWQNVRGADPTLDPIDEPTKNPNLQGGRRAEIVFGPNVHPTEGFFKTQEFFADVEKPIFQSLDGPQLQRSWAVRLGSQWEF